ncbi:acyltransferase [Pseudomonas nabeulensis]|uniref:Acyltransferase n=1 Tax=Pseudomonas nabeulensis TaxID=2293833 RepID=A0A4Z0BA09_9PSED|nr:acyltransferase [Pseudomonas nabeulensis]TFY95892.1 acyltransferase [Pseudomonas nabeulensis]
MLDRKQLPKHLYSLDIVRGLAALVVVLWHWQHLLYTDGVSSSYRLVDQPFYSAFSIFYNHGWMAVDFFFSLSGFVFFWLYSDSIANKRIGGATFFVVRFSRLYPLHFVTFVFVLVMQLLLHAKTGSYFVYQNNDVYRAVLNLFLASSWGVLPGYSFNGPIWSVSVEVLLYFVFFVTCLTFSNKYLVAAACAVAGIVINEFLPEVGRGMFSFFVGGLTFWIYSKAATCARAKALTALVAIFALAVWGCVFIDYEYSYLTAGLQQLLESVLPGGYSVFIPGLIYRISHLSIFGVVFPFSILALALVETLRGGLGKRFAVIGHLSYSSYLLHFPLELVFFVVALNLGIDREFFYSKYALLLFGAILIPLCLLSYHYFELPMQRFFRARLTSKWNGPVADNVVSRVERTL